MTDVIVHRARFVEWAPKTVFALAFVKKATDGARARVAIARASAELELWTFDEFGSRWHWEWRVPGICGGSVRALAWGGGCRLFVAGIEGTILELNLRQLRYERAIRPCGGAVWAMAVCPRQAFLAAGCNDGHVRLFSLNQDCERGDEWRPSASECGVLAYHRSLICGSSNDGVRSLRTDVPPPRALAVSWHPSDQTSIFAGCSDGIIRRFSTITGICEMRVAAGIRGEHSRPGTSVLALCVLTDSTVISGDSHGNVQFWDGKLGTMVATFKKHEAGVLALAVSADECRIFGSGVDSRVAMFQRCCPSTCDAIRRGVPRSCAHWVYSYSHRAHTHDVRTMATHRFHGQNNRTREYKSREVLVTGGADAKLCCYSVPLFELTYPKNVMTVPHGGGRNGSSTISCAESCGFRPMLVQHDRVLDIWKLERASAFEYSATHSNRCRQRRDVTEGLSKRHLLQLVVSSNCHITCSAISPDGRTIALSNSRGIRFYALEYCDHNNSVPIAVRSYKNVGLPCMRALIIAICPKNSRAVVAADDGSVSVLTLRPDVEGNCDVVRHMTLVPGANASVAVISLVVSTDAKWVACGDVENGIRVFNLENGHMHAKLPTLRAMHTALSFCPSLGTTASCAEEVTIESRGTIETTILLVPCVDNHVYFYDVTSQRDNSWSIKPLLPQLLRHQECIVNVAVSPTRCLAVHRLVLFSSRTSMYALNLPAMRPMHECHPARPCDLTKEVAAQSPEKFIQRRYGPMLFAGFITRQEILVIEWPWRRIMKTYSHMLRNNSGKFI